MVHYFVCDCYTYIYPFSTYTINQITEEQIGNFVLFIRCLQSVKT